MANMGIKQRKSSPGVFQVIQNGVVFELQREPEGGYTISVPSLPGCISEGNTFEEAEANIREAIGLFKETQTTLFLA